MNQEVNNEVQTLQEHANQFEVAKQNSLLQRMEQDFVILDETIQHDTYKATIPEHYFKNIFLPFFLGIEVTVPSDGVNPARLLTVEDWFGVCDGQNREVDVLDDNTGEVLFTVPSVINTSKFITAGPRTYSMNEVWKVSQEERDLNPNGANDRNYNELTKMIVGINEDIINNTDSGWYAIFKRYGFITEDNKVNEKAITEVDKAYNPDKEIIIPEEPSSSKKVSVTPSSSQLTDEVEWD